jgi:hypothetical protein
LLRYLVEALLFVISMEKNLAGQSFGARRAVRIVVTLLCLTPFPALSYLGAPLGRVAGGNRSMPIDPERIARWRDRAEHYRRRANASATPGERLAYLALGEAADEIAVRLAQEPAPAAPPTRPRAAAGDT